MNWDSDSDESINNEQTGQDAENAATFILIVVDTDEDMFSSDPKFGKSTFQTVLESCYEVMDGLLLKVSRGKTNQIALMITSEDKEKSTICDFNDHFPLALKSLRLLIENTDDKLKAKYLRTGPLDFANILLQSKLKFTQCPQESVKYLVYVTKNDNPVLDDEDLKFRSVNQAKTLVDFNVHIELFTFNEDFNYGVFFKEILFSAKSTFMYDYLVDTSGFKEKLLGLIKYRGKKLRFYPFSDWNESNSRNFEIIEKRYIKEQKILNNVTVTKDTNKEVRKIKRGVTVLNSYKFSYSKDDDALKFSFGEVTKMNVGLPPGYVLLGRCEKLLEPGMHNTDPTFLQDNPRQNLPYFVHFWQYCVDKNQVLICTRRYKTDGPIRVVELSPKIINNVKSFLVLGIPFIEDVSGIEYEEHDVVNLSKRELQAAEDLVQAADFNYKVSMFPDTVLCKKREYLRSQLLDEPPRDVKDILNVNLTGDLVENIRDFMEAFGIGTEGKKRKAPTSDIGKTKSKKGNIK